MTATEERCTVSLPTKWGRALAGADPVATEENTPMQRHRIHEYSGMRVLASSPPPRADLTHGGKT